MTNPLYDNLIELRIFVLSGCHHSNNRISIVKRYTEKSFLYFYFLSGFSTDTLLQKAKGLFNLIVYLQAKLYTSAPNVAA